MEAGGRRVSVQQGIARKKVKKGIDKLKYGKYAGVDGITSEMVEYGGNSDGIDMFAM